jgi:hypothetical protein
VKHPKKKHITPKNQTQDVHVSGVLYKWTTPVPMVKLLEVVQGGSNKSRILKILLKNHAAQLNILQFY